MITLSREKLMQHMLLGVHEVTSVSSYTPRRLATNLWRYLGESTIMRVSFGSCGRVLSISEVNFIVGCSTCIRCRRKKFMFAISSAGEFLVDSQSQQKI